MSTTLILGTAGHIDHGKTSLIRALSGIDTDRLPEEKRRGITIELGYAHLQLGDYHFGIVDVPGHEKFVRHMLAGATGMDLALLVVACDDGVKQQTREHFEILQLLRVSRGVIVLTKRDLVDAEAVAFVREEVAELVADTPLQQAEIVEVSSKTGAGMDSLRAALLSAAAAADTQRINAARDAPFRMAIDRVFTMEGHGCVVTGTVYSGSAELGSELQLQPSARAVRIKLLQNHGTQVKRIFRGQRAAVNVAGVHYEQVQRGDEIAAPGYLQPSRLMTATVRLLNSAKRSISRRDRFKIHLGTSERSAIGRLIEGHELSPGGEALMQLYFTQPCSATWQQPFVIRQETPAETIGGGRIVDPTASPLRRVSASDLERLRDWADGDPATRLEAAVYFAEALGGDPLEVMRQCGVPEAKAALQQLSKLGRIVECADKGGHTTWVHSERIDQLAGYIVDWFQRQIERKPTQRSLPLQQVQQAFERRRYGNGPFQAALKKLVAAGKVELSADRIALVRNRPKMSDSDQKLMNALSARLSQAGLAVPTLKELQQENLRQAKSVESLLQWLVETGQVVRLNDELFISISTLEEVQKVLLAAFATSPRMTLAEIREALQTTRKYAVPLAEYLDLTGFTRRDGDVRSLVRDASRS